MMFDKDDYIKLFEEYNDPAISYLRDHAYRFLSTKELVQSGLTGTDKKRLLDIPSHWLHNALLYARDGYKVTACDLAGGEISNSSVINCASDYDIELIPCKSLQNPVELDNLPDNIFDIVMFTEVIEHITFNPVRMWNVIYKKMKEGGKIIVTTPNYHYIRGAILNDINKLFTGYSTGIAVRDIIEIQDYAPHWKEYTKKDIYEYFSTLSPDFIISRIIYNDLYGWRNIGRVEKLMQERLFPRFFSPTMYVEIALPKKNTGIVPVPHC